MTTTAAQGERDAIVARIGDTPLRAVDLVVDGRPRRVQLKLEHLNPGGSVKDRTAAALVESLERQGLEPGGVIVESTSGNLGISLAMICQARGFGFIAVVDPKLGAEFADAMRGYGAELVVEHRADPMGNYLLARLDRVREICASASNHIWANQYANVANPQAHYVGTGPEIFRQLGERVGAVFVATGTGGTLAGIGRYFREIDSGARVIAVDAIGSVIFGGQPGKRRLAGIGSARRSDFITTELYDAHVAIGDGEAFACCRALDAAIGLRLGGSSGAVIAGCARYLAEHPQVDRIVCVCGDGGDRYLSSIYDDGWLRAMHIAHPALTFEIRDCEPDTPAMVGRSPVGYAHSLSSIKQP